jgi:two-component system OmpR family response regulator
LFPAQEAASCEARILFIEDDGALAADITRQLDQMKNGEAHEPMSTITSERPPADVFHLLVLDMTFGLMGRVFVIEYPGPTKSGIPILLLDPSEDKRDSVGTSIANDRYLSPVFLTTISSSLEPLTRRRKAAPRDFLLRSGPLEIDLIDRVLRRGNREVNLLPRECSLLSYLVQRPNQIVSRDTILTEVWRYRVLPRTNLVDVHMSALRRKVDAPGEKVLLHSVRALGFVLRIDD